MVIDRIGNMKKVLKAKLCTYLEKFIYFMKAPPAAAIYNLDVSGVVIIISIGD